MLDNHKRLLEADLCFHKIEHKITLPNENSFTMLKVT